MNNPTNQNPNSGAKGFRPWLPVAAALLFAGAAPMLAADHAASPGVSPPGSAPYGRTYPQWSAAHWQWLFAQPFNEFPLVMDGAVDLSLGQPSGPVWFLGGTFAVTTVGTTNIGVANRTGTVPAGKALFFPLIDSEDSVAEEIAGLGCSPAGTCTNETCLRQCAGTSIDAVTSVFCLIDGVPVKNLQNYRFQSPLFTWGPLPANNLFQDPVDFPGGLTSQSASDGYFVMIAPLPAGKHTLNFGGTIASNFLFLEDITYHITVR